MSDPLLAITRLDADDLSRVLASGWEPSRIRAKHVTVADHAAWTEVVLRDWVEGLKLLDQSYPDITRHPDIWRIALRNASHKCVEYLWNALNLDAERFSLEARQDCVVALAAAMGEPWSPSYEIRDIQPMLDMFSRHGVSLDVPAPGDFEPGDLRMAGHSLFTRAVATRRWDVVLSTWPDPNKPLPNWPRLDEVLVGTLDVVGGDYKPLMASSFVEARARLEAVDFRNLYFKPGGFQQSGVVDDRFICAWMTDFHHQWPSADASLISTLSMPSRSRIAPWLRLPLLMETLISRVDEAGQLRDIPDSLSPESLRKPIWSAWSRVLAADDTQTWLRSLVIDPQDPEVISLLALIKSEAPEIISTYWNTPSSADGLSPAQVWEIQTVGDT